MNCKFRAWQTFVAWIAGAVMTLAVGGLARVPFPNGDSMTAHFTVDPNRFLDEHASRLVAAYFGGLDQSRYTGRMFERLAGGGDHEDRRDRFDATDLVAVTMLGVDVAAETAIWILGEGGAQLTDLLNQIPADVSLSEAPEALIADDSPAVELWQTLQRLPDIAWVKAGKLCARKRPHLLPVYDKVVNAALHAPAAFWLSLHSWMQERSNVDRLNEVRDEAGIGNDISLLRIFDVAIWMRCHGMQNVAALSDVPPPS